MDSRTPFKISILCYLNVARAWHMFWWLCREYKMIQIVFHAFDQARKCDEEKFYGNMNDIAFKFEVFHMSAQ